jgi:glycosyltransferase involved in cell wall biosynthesis
LFNEIAQRKRILVLFAKTYHKRRKQDFYQGQFRFDYVLLGEQSFFKRLWTVHKLLKTTAYTRLIVGRWDNLLYWVAVLLSRKGKNGMMLESSILESGVNGIKGWIKKVFMCRIRFVYASGKHQIALAKALGFNGTIIQTKGVGLFNRVKQPAYTPVAEVRNFVYVGRLSPEKNLKTLIRMFNLFPDLNLWIIGYGPQEEELKQLANENTRFAGVVENFKLPDYYATGDVFILPSLSEPWGLVVEEALNNGLPVIASNKVGCMDDVLYDGINGIIFPVEEPDGLKKAIQKILDVAYYNTLKKNVAQMDFEKRAAEQVASYTEI